MARTRLVPSAFGLSGQGCAAQANPPTSQKTTQTTLRIKLPEQPGRYRPGSVEKHEIDERLMKLIYRPKPVFWAVPRVIPAFSLTINWRHPMATAAKGSANIKASVVGMRCPKLSRCCWRWITNSTESHRNANERSQRV